MAATHEFVPARSDSATETALPDLNEWKVDEIKERSFAVWRFEKTTTTNDTLEPLTPSEAKETFLAERRGQVAENTVRADHYRLRHFIRWTENNGIDNMNDLDGRTLHKFRLWRKDDGDLNKVSLRTQLKSLRVFIRWCEPIDAVPEGLHEKVLFPTPSNDEERHEEILRDGRAEEVLDYLRRFEYASRAHTLLELLWHTGLRIGAVHGLDFNDYDADEVRLHLKHRPSTDTP